MHQAAQSLLHRSKMVYSVPPRSSLTTVLAGGGRARQGRWRGADALALAALAGGVPLVAAAVIGWVLLRKLYRCVATKLGCLA